MDFVNWLFNRVGRTDGIALNRLMELLFEYLTGTCGLEPLLVANSLWTDYRRGGRKDKPSFLCPFLPPDTGSEPPRPRSRIPKRQARRVNS